MPALLIKDFPKHLHQRLKEVAAENRRSMTQQAIVLLEHALQTEATVKPLPPPLKGKFPITERFLQQAKRMGRP